jgi:hypothetical protein
LKKASSLAIVAPLGGPVRADARDQWTISSLRCRQRRHQAF